MSSAPRNSPLLEGTTYNKSPTSHQRFFAPLATGEHTIITDAAGMTWRTAGIYESSALLAVYGMVFIALLAMLRIAQRHTAVDDRQLAGHRRPTAERTVQ